MSATDEEVSLNEALKNSCCMLELSIGVPTKRRVDRDASKKLDHELNAKEGVGRTTAYLFQGNDELINEADAIKSSLQKFTNLMTNPWGRQGTSSRKLLANTLFETWITGYKAYFDKFGDVIKRVEHIAPDLINNGKAALGGYNVRWPTPEQLVASFYMSYAIEPVPMQNGFGEVSSVIDTFLQRQFKYNMEMSYKSGQADRLSKLRPLVANIIDRMQAYEERLKKKETGDAGKAGTFHGTLITNVRDLVPALEALNVIGDPGLAAICERLKKIKDVDVEDLKGNRKLRSSVQDEAQDMLGDIDKWLKSAPGSV